MTKSSAALGRLGEDLAADYLRDRGLRILDRNWRCATGELDIVATDGCVIVFCEVKTRSTDAFGPAVAAVGVDKARRLRRLAAMWLRERGATGAEVRFDVIGILVCANRRPEIDHRLGVLG
jgi:putative endonuclease